MMSMALFELHFFGGSRWQSYASLILFNFGGGVGLWALLRWLIAFPQEVPESARLSPHWAWLGFLFVVLRMNYIVGGPIPTQTIPLAVLASDGLFILTTMGILTWNTYHASAVGRRRCKWVLLGVYLTTIPMLLSIVPSFIDLEGIEYFETLPYAFLFGAAFPLTTLMAIIRYDLFDIDRLLSSTASYSLAVGALLAALVAAAPPIAAAVSGVAGIDEQATLWLLASGLVVAALPLGRLVRRYFDRVIFPERRRREIGFQQLFADLSECASVSETLRLLVDRVQGLLEPEFAIALVSVGMSWCHSTRRGMRRSGHFPPGDVSRWRSKPIPGRSRPTTGACLGGWRSSPRKNERCSTIGVFASSYPCDRVRIWWECCALVRRDRETSTHRPT